jgi:hypothetical protein
MNKDIFKFKNIFYKIKMSLYDYVSYLFGYDNKNKDSISENIIIESEPIIQPKKFLINKEDLNKLNLKHREDVVPEPSKNMPLLDTFELSIVNKAQLDEILNIKLKPTPKVEKPIYYPPRNPVIRQMNEKFGIGVQNYA